MGSAPVAARPDVSRRHPIARAVAARGADATDKALTLPRGRGVALAARWWGHLWRWGSEPWVHQVLAVFVASRIGFALVTYLGYVLLLAPKYSTGSVGLSGLLDAWNQWDATRYLGIAAHGYPTPDVTAFFPLYPLLIAGITAPVGGQGAYAVSLVIANLAFLGALLLLRVLVAARWGASTAERAVVYLTVFPTALYTFAPYNESLFLLWTIGCFVALSRRRWALAGGLGALATLTRPAGLLLLIPFAYEWWLIAHPVAALPGWALARRGTGQRRSEPPANGREVAKVARGMRPVAGIGALAWGLLMPAALGAFATFCAWRFGDPLAFLHAQAQWNRVSQWPWVGLWWQVTGLLRAAPASFFQIHDLLDLSATVGFIALWVAGWRRLPRAQLLYMGGLLLLALSSPGGVHLHTNDPLTSNQRFVLEMFPGFILLAVLTERRPRWHQAIVLLSTMLLATLTLVFILGRWLV
ncbi:MAG TPA: mannosyltransferase family protein [Ktedonobacterales bacterium]|nr:mannosyltransferase family protein [Ktedonobacterales bacterium]